MLTDLNICDLLQQQYDGNSSAFDIVSNVAGVDWAFKLYNGMQVICFEGSHNVPDWIRDFEAVMSHTMWGGVEEGFYTGMTQVAARLLPDLSFSSPLIVAGHSLGAAHAHILTAMLIAKGFTPERIKRVTFGSPRVGDKNFCGTLKNSPVRSYRNYGSILDQDYVCTVPTWIPIWAPYHHPGEYIYIDVPAEPDDKWLFLRRHHLFLYRKGLANDT